MAKAQKNLCPEIYTKVLFRAASLMVLVNITGQKVAFTRVSSLMAIVLVTEYGKEAVVIVISMRVIIVRTRSKGMGFTPGWEETYTKGIILTIFAKVTVRCTGRMEAITKGNGGKAIKKDKECSLYHERESKEESFIRTLWWKYMIRCSL